MDRAVLLNELIEYLSYKLENNKTCEARKFFECYGCGEDIEKGEDFYFLGGGRYCPDCMQEALDEAKAWSVELEKPPAEDKRERGAAVVEEDAGGDIEML